MNTATLTLTFFLEWEGWGTIFVFQIWNMYLETETFKVYFIFKNRLKIGFRNLRSTVFLKWHFEPLSSSRRKWNILKDFFNSLWANQKTNLLFFSSFQRTSFRILLNYFYFWRIFKNLSITQPLMGEWASFLPTRCQM